MEKREISEAGIVADFFTEPTDRPRRTIIMLGGSEGGKSWSRINKPIQALVQREFNVLSLAYFKSAGLPDSLELIPLEYFSGVFKWLSRQAEVIPHAYTIIGASKGAEAGLLLASMFPQVKAVVAFSPTHVIWQGIPENRWDLGKFPKSSWSYQGEGLPFLSYFTPISRWEILTLRLRNLHEMALLANTVNDDACIPVENSQAAILLISARRDRIWPSTPMSDHIAWRLKENGFTQPYKHISLDSGHNGIIMSRDLWRYVFRFLEENVSYRMLT